LDNKVFDIIDARCNHESQYINLTTPSISVQTAFWNNDNLI